MQLGSDFRGVAAGPNQVLSRDRQFLDNGTFFVQKPDAIIVESAHGALTGPQEYLPNLKGTSKPTVEPAFSFFRYLGLNFLCQ